MLFNKNTKINTVTGIGITDVKKLRQGENAIDVGIYATLIGIALTLVGVAKTRKCSAWAFANKTTDEAFNAKMKGSMGKGAEAFSELYYGKSND